MIAPESIALILLAAGRSRRFLGGDKLVQPFLGRPLAYHVVTALEPIPFAMRIAVVSDTGLDFTSHGYRTIENTDPDSGQARSLRLGVGAAAEAGATAVLIALADMPRVTAGHVTRLMEAGGGIETIVASSDGIQPRPPALFGEAWFDVLLGLDGDSGARELIRRGQHVIAEPYELVDIDTREDLRRLREYSGDTGDAK